MSMSFCLFLGGPFDGDVRAIDDHRDEVDLEQQGTRSVYGRHWVIVDGKDASMFVLNGIGHDESSRRLNEWAPDPSKPAWPR
jgi:hypothetical protein